MKDPDNNLSVKFADDMTVSAPVKENYDTASTEVDNIEKWTEANRTSLNLTKDRIDKFLRQAHRYGYTSTSVQIIDVVKEKGMSLFEKICSNRDHPLYELLPPIRQRSLREREHDFILPKVKTERFRWSFFN